MYIVVSCASVSTFGDADRVLLWEGGAGIERVAAQIPWRLQDGGAGGQCAEVAVLCQSKQWVTGCTAHARMTQKTGR